MYESRITRENPKAEPFTLRLIQPEAAVRSLPEFSDLVTLWLDRRTNTWVPDWSSVEFSDFRGWHSALVVSAFEGAEPDPKWRIVGNDYNEMAGVGNTGKRFSDVLPRLYQLQLRDHFAAIREHGLIGLSEGRLSAIDRGHIHVKIMELPFTDGDCRIERLVHAIVRL